MVKKTFEIPLPVDVITKEPVKITRELLPADLESTDDITIFKIDEIKNVNALAVNGITFTSKAGVGLTIVYGRNGSGKSGFIRILKAVSAFRKKESEPIYENCITGDNTTPSAKIHTSDNDTPHTWNRGETGSSFARKMRIFDSKSAEIYVNDKTEIVYSPDCFTLLSELASVMETVGKKLSADKQALVNPFQIVNQKFQEQSIKSLEITKDTPDATIADLLSWDDTKEAQLKKIKPLIDDKAALKEKKQRLKTQLESNLASFQEIEGFLSIGKIKELFEKNAEKKRLKDSLKTLQELTMKDNPLPGVCDTPWENLWKSAIAFMGKTFPTDNVGDTCPLCMQPITGDAKERIEKFHAWVSNDIKKTLDEVNEFLTPKGALFQSVKSKLSVPTQLEEALKIDVELQTKIGSFLAAASDNLNVLEEKIKSETFQEQNFKEIMSCEHLSEVVEQLGKEITELDTPATPEQIALHEKLKANTICRQLPEQVKKSLESYNKTFDNFNKAAEACSTESISRLKTRLNKTFLNDKFNNLVESERNFFDLSYRIILDISSERGKSMQSLACENASKLSPGQFMSEGEAKIASLSCFIAEYKMSGAKIPLVFDDPVTSLDHEFQSRVVKRLAELSKETQVIVFTSHLVFYKELLRETQTENEKYLKKESGASGIVHPGEWECKSVGGKIDQIRNALKGLQDSDQNAICEQGGKIREIWEQAIEDELFYKTITRFQKEVMTKRLKVVRIDDAIYPMVEAGMTKTTEWANHSKADAVDARITKDDVKEELKKVEEFLKYVEEKRGTAKKKKEKRII
ncbi:MAG: AAA family ATPase [Holosporaceae bacterium]|nr:AAA family ATPase [Holosporaceae bacterium]